MLDSKCCGDTWNNRDGMVRDGGESFTDKVTFE